MNQRTRQPDGSDDGGEHRAKPTDNPVVPEVEDTLAMLNEAADTPNTAPQTEVMNKISHGPDDIEANVTGYKVGKLRKSLKGTLNIGEGANAYVEGNEVNENYVMKEGQQLEFMKESGQKG